jgi:hypothetical protein
MTTTRTLHVTGHLVTLEPPYDDRVVRRYIGLVLSGDMSEDEFWPKMRQEYPILPLGPIREFIASGGIVPAPPKTPATDLVDGGWYWIRKHPDSDWEIAKVERSGDDAGFWEILKDWSTDYDDILAIGPLVPDYVPDEGGHVHEEGSCPLCDETQLAEMRADNLARRADRRRTLLAEIEADPTAFVHVVEGYDNAEDRSPVIMLISRTLQGAREYCASMEGNTDGLFEITPNRLDDRRTGEVVLYHSIVENGTRVEREGRFLRG